MTTIMQRSGYESFCRFAAAWLTAAGLLAAAGTLIAWWTPAVTPEELALRAAPFLKSIHHGMKPEPAESAVYFGLCLLAFPAAAAGWAAVQKLPQKYLAPIPFLWGAFFALLFAGNGGFHVVLEALDTPIRLILWIVTAAALGRMLLLRKNWNISSGMIHAAVLLTALGVIFCCRIHAPARMDQNFDEHANIILYAINAAVHGMGDLHFYGFYPHFLAPVFRVTGTGLIPVSLVMNLLYLAAIFLAVAAAEKWIRNRLLVLLFGISLPLLLNGYDFFLSDISLRIEPYFAYYPIRMLFPMGMAALFCCIPDKKFHLLRRIAPVIGAAACYFSPDSGIAAAGAAFVGCAAPVLNREMRRDGIRFALQFAGIFAGSLALFPLILMVWSGSMPPLSDYFHYMKLYQQSGLIMLPVEPLPSTWLAVVLIYLGAILWGSKQIYTGSGVRRGSILLFLAVLGCGLFLYYVGRSHPKNLVSCSWPALLLLFAFADRVLRGIRSKQLPGWMAAGALPAVLLAAALPWIPLTRLPKLWTAWQFTAWSFVDPSETDRLIGKILTLTEGEDTINLLSPMQGILYGETGKRPGMRNFNLVELLIQSEMDRSMEEFRKAQYPLLIHGDGILPADVLAQYVAVHRDAEDLFVYYIPKKRLTASARSSAVSQ